MNILVLCTGNSARSILLESLLNHLGPTGMTAYSAGSHPTGQVNLHALHLLEKQGHDVSGFASKSWDLFAERDAPNMDIVITVCGSAASETCPMWPGTPLRAHWGVEDPAAFADADAPQAFADAFAILKRRADHFLARPVAQMDRATLQAHLTRSGEVA